jgi:hypothetical protein
MTSKGFLAVLLAMTLCAIVIISGTMLFLFPPNGSYLPAKETTHVLKLYENGKGQTLEKEYTHFQDGYVQVIENGELRFYYSDASGVYEVLANLSGKDPDQNWIPEVAGADRKLILKLPAKQADKWESAGQTFQIATTNEILKTSAGLFKEVIKVRTQMDGIDVFQYYHKDTGLILVEKVPAAQEELIVEVIASPKQQQGAQPAPTEEEESNVVMELTTSH